ncbi:pyridoxal phosphate-dependent aminotransferase [Aquibacillus salsiterrae]|uniref:Pyridoxal phosphate-dependent aminotransferase n=1 Tax=Aquibacillus salsiterrae TaxID=2950439 RepID=A0A9X3WEJ4_9BACI|nr:pyridoxal phosphate-dependent aminotransferase [Aquibacillus salsiterrae]MDC3415964.1 pyridoxal phosphate-dependent aminotransferase [Aquibacillus salsiterrae]
MQRFNQSELLKRLPEQFFASLVAKAKKLKDEGHDLVNLGQGNPDLPTPPHIVEELNAAAGDPLYHKYSPFQGFPFLKEAICSYYKREYDVELDPNSEVAILFGAKTGLVEISQCLLNPGDTVLVPDPGYPDYMSGIALANAKATMMPLLVENDFLPDYSTLHPSTLQEAKLMFLNYPNNPTSATATKPFFDETVELARKHNICIAHDFAYGAIGFDGEKPTSFLQSDGAKDVGVEFYTMSKTYNMAGWRVGFAVGNQSVIKAIELLQDHLYVSLFGGIQHAAAKALLADQTSVTELVATYQRRRDVFIGGLNKIGWKVPPSKGTFFVWLPVPPGYTSEQFSEMLMEKAHVVTAPGNGFGSSGEGYLRVGLLDSEERLLEAVDRIDKLNLF